MNHSKPVITVIIPVHNMARYIDQTLTEWTTQTLSEIEIIVIEDGSTDNTPELLRQWENRDSRIRAFYFPENRSTWTARNLGIREARGDYIMFADADDGIEPDACAVLYERMKKHPVDIIQFSTDIINVNNQPEGRIKGVERFLLPYDGTLRGEEVLLKCFRDREYGFNLWNKIFSASLCKRALSEEKDAMLTNGEDGLAYFMIAYYADSYQGYREKALYHYYYGRGGNGKDNLNLEQYKCLCSMNGVAQRARDFLLERNASEEYMAAEAEFRRVLLRDCVRHWFDRVLDRDKCEGFDILMSHWEADEVIACMAEKKKADKYALAKQLAQSKALKPTRKEIKTIAAYYFRIQNGGVQRVLCAPCELWVRMGYKVIVLTDEPADERDYTLPDSVKRIVIPDCWAYGESHYQERAAALQRILREHQVDAVVYHAWASNLMLWDEMTIKLAGVWFIGHCHSIFTAEFFSQRNNLKKMVSPYLMADAIAVLSSYDKHFWSHFHSNVFQVNNPLTGRLEDWETSDCSSHNVLWLGRISREKRPLDALTIFSSVLKRVPDAKLILVGGGRDEALEESVRNTVVSMGLEQHVELCGFQNEVMPYYRNASVFLMTSEYEGYPMTLQESMLAGIPTVMYELPYLTLTKDNPGIFAVRQQSVQEAANAIVDLLTNDEERKQRGRQAREFIEEFAHYDYEGMWKRIFDSVTQERTSQLPEDERAMMELLVLHLNARQNMDSRNQRLVAQQAKRIHDLESSVSFRLGRAITWLPRKVRGGVRCFKEHGVGYTVRRTLYHMGLRKDEETPKQAGEAFKAGSSSPTHHSPDEGKAGK